MKNMMSSIIKAAVCAAALVTFCQTSFADTDYSKVELKSAIMLPKATEIKPFKVDYLAQDSKTKKLVTKEFTNDNLKGHWTLMFYGFTNCPALCPTTMAQLSNAYKQLTADKYQPMPQVVFVSVDPQRDTLEKVHTFATTFNPNFIGARTDDMEMLKTMTKEMDAMFTKVNAAGKDKDKHSTYTINHTGDIIVLNPKGEFVGLLTMPHADSDIVADYKKMIETLNTPAAK